MESSLSIQQSQSTQDELRHMRSFKALFDSTTEGAILYDHHGTILLINPAAVALLGLASATNCLGHPYQHYIHLSETDGGTLLPIPDELGPLARVFQSEDNMPAQAKYVFLRQPGGHNIPVDIYCAPALDHQQHPSRAICTIHRIRNQSQQESQLQQALHVLCTLMDDLPGANGHGPALHNIPEMDLLSSPEIKTILQRITDLLQQQLDCKDVRILAADFAENRMHYVAMSGFSQQQRQQRHDAASDAPISAFINTSLLTRMLARGFLVIPRAHLPLPPELQDDLEPETLLCVPLIVHNQAFGSLTVGKAGDDNTYTSQEIELVEDIASIIALFLRQIRLQIELTQLHTSEQALRETNQRINAFLNLASHELRTPLTIVMGNLQRVQRRLQVNQQPESSQQVDSLLHSLDEALQGTHLLERMINDMLDDSLLQTHTLVLHKQRYDLRELLHTSIANQQRVAPGRSLVLEMITPDQPVTVLIDPERISRVLDTFLRNALEYSPEDSPIIVSLHVDDAAARVAVRDRGPGIPLKEHPLIWERFYRTTGVAVQHELDLSLGLGLYLCQAFIELHNGHIGVESTPGQGATFWFTLPLVFISLEAHQDNA